LDDNPGNGDPNDGDAEGQSNLYLVWKTTNIVDRSDHWEMSVSLVARAPKDECSVNLTPRRLQQLRLASGQELTWTNLSLPGQGAIQSGRTTADRDGLVTLEKVRVTKSGNRIVLAR
jgi:hypothetical protein